MLARIVALIILALLTKWCCDEANNKNRALWKLWNNNNKIVETMEGTKLEYHEPTQKQMQNMWCFGKPDTTVEEIWHWQHGYTEP